MWDSGKVSTDTSSVEYDGSTLAEDTTYYWKVMTWDEYALAGLYSGVQSFWTESGGTYGGMSIGPFYTMLEKVFNYPNPFGNEGTMFVFDLNVYCYVTLKVYTLTGRLIRVVLDEEQGFPGDNNEAFWDGLDEDMNKLANGVYLYRIIAEIEGESRKTKVNKLMIMK